MKYFKKFSALILAAALAAGLFVQPASADNLTVVPEAQSLRVYITEAGQTTLLHEYSPGELLNLSDFGVWYSSIDAMPATVLTVTNGVYIEDLIYDLEAYAGKSVENFVYFKMSAPDGWSRSFERNELFQTRYYYSNLFNIQLVDGKADPSSVGPGVPVRPMLAVESWQDRVPVNTSMPSSPGLSAGNRFRFCIGQLPSDLTSGDSTTTLYGRGVNEVYVIMDANASKPEVTVTGLTITPEEGARIETGKTVQITAKVIPSDATNKDVSWESSNTAVATVTSGGLVRGVSEGSAVITATAVNSSYSKSCTVTVTEAGKVAVTGISLDRSAAAIKKDGTIRLTATVAPSNASNKNVLWSSGSASVASVDANGNVRGLSAGTAVITARTEDGSFSAACTVTVSLTEVKVTGVTLDSTEATIKKGGTQKLTATVNPPGATNTTVYWSSSVPGVASVDASGNVTGRGEGTSVITAETEDGYFRADCTVTVTLSDVRVTGVALNRGELAVKKGGSYALTATVSPLGATNKNILWSSSDTGIAAVDINGTVTAKEEGAAVITAETEDGAFAAFCTVTVTLADVKVTGISLNPRYATVKTGETMKITAAVSPSNAFNDKVIWESSDPGAVRVDDKGNVFGIAEGVSVIRATTEDGGFYDSCTVTVTAAEPQKVKISLNDCEGHWARESIERLAGLGVVSGYDDGGFHPEDDVTRGQFLKILIGAMEIMGKAEITPGAGFSDTEGHWSADYVSTAVSMGIVSGYGNNTFAPDEKITREQIAVMLARAAGITPSGSVISYTDADKIAPWARDAVIATSEDGLYAGNPDGSFSPAKNASRAEAAVLVLRFFDKYGGAK